MGRYDMAGSDTVHDLARHLKAYRVSLLAPYSVELALPVKYFAL